MNFTLKNRQRCWNCKDCVDCIDRKKHPECLNCSGHKSDCNPLHWISNWSFLRTEPVVERKDDTTQKSYYKIKMLQPIQESAFRPQEPKWRDECDKIVSWYVPVLFPADETFANIHVDTDENNDWINLYILYEAITEKVTLMLVYAGENTYWEAPVEMDLITKNMVEKIIKEKAKKFIEEND